jgi:hypothetical protein
MVQTDDQPGTSWQADDIDREIAQRFLKKGQRFLKKGQRFLKKSYPSLIAAVGGAQGLIRRSLCLGLPSLADSPGRLC